MGKGGLGTAIVQALVEWFAALSERQTARISPHFPLSHGVPRVDDQRVVAESLWPAIEAMMDIHHNFCLNFEIIGQFRVNSMASLTQRQLSALLLLDEAPLAYIGGKWIAIGDLDFFAMECASADMRQLVRLLLAEAGPKVATITKKGRRDLPSLVRQAKAISARTAHRTIQ